MSPTARIVTAVQAIILTAVLATAAYAWEPVTITDPTASVSTSPIAATVTGLNSNAAVLPMEPFCQTFGTTPALSAMTTADAVQPFLPVDNGNNGTNICAVSGMEFGTSSLFYFHYNNYQATMIASGTYSSTQTGADFPNPDGRGVLCTYNVSAVTGSGSFTVEIDDKDTTSNVYTAALTAVAKLTTGTVQLLVYPGTTAASNLVANVPLSNPFRVKATYNSGTSQTFSVGCNILQ